MKRLKSLFLILLCLVLVVPVMDGNAATEKQQALKAYKKFLSTAKVNVVSRSESTNYKGTKASQVKFALAYIDNDNVPELILYTKSGGEDVYGCLTYKKGKVRRVVLRTIIHDNIVGYYKKTGYFVQKRYSNGKLSDWRYLKMVSNRNYSFIVGNRANDGSYYVFYERGMSKKAFYAKLKKETKGRPFTKLKFYKNTKANRTKRLK